MRRMLETIAGLSVLVIASAAAAQPVDDAAAATPDERLPWEAAPASNQAMPPQAVVPAAETAAAPVPPGLVPATTIPAETVQDILLEGESRYGRLGVREVGGSAGLLVTGNLNFAVAPTVGWFVSPNLEMSGILSVAHVDAGDTSGTMWTVLAEPSYHMPFNPLSFGFAGLGVGIAYEDKLGMGLAVAPRVGANFLVGDAGVLTPALQYQYVTHNNMHAGNAALDTLASALQLSLGYTRMW